MSFLSQPVTLQSIFGNSRKIDSISVNVILNEETNDTLTITKQPVQQGASITDHAYSEPTVLSMSILQQNNASFLPSINDLLGSFAGPGTSGLALIYKQFLDLQSARTPFDVITPKKVYKNMLMSGLRMVTDKTTENILSLNCSFQQLIVVTIGVASVPLIRQRSPQKTQAIQNTGQNQSAFYTGAQGIGLRP